MAPSLGLGIGIDKPSQGIARNATPYYLADWGILPISGWNVGTGIGSDRGAITIAGWDARLKIGINADRGALTIAGYNAGLSAIADTGSLAIAGADARYKVGIRADAGSLAIVGLNAQTKVGIRADVGAIAIAGVDARTKVGIRADVGILGIAGYDAEWEEDFVAVYDPVTATVITNATASNVFSIAGIVAWITAPITTATRTVTLEHTPDSGTTWNSTGVTWATSTSLQVEVNSETLAKIAGVTGPGLNNFRLKYDTALSANTSHIVRSRT